MKIQLKDLPSEGKTYSFSRQDGRLNSALKDLVGSHSYEAEVFVQPVGGAFVVRGHGKFQGDDLCSKCGWETSLSLTGDINEYLVIEKDRPRTAHSTHGNKSLELESDGPETTYLSSYTFDLGEFVHEQFALIWPVYPECRNLAECRERRAEAEKKLVAETEVVREPGHPAFKVLDHLKKKH